MNNAHKPAFGTGTDLPPRPGLAQLEAMLDADEADVAAGRVAPAEPMLAKARATAKRIRRERALKQSAAHPGE